MMTTTTSLVNWFLVMFVSLSADVCLNFRNKCEFFLVVVHWTAIATLYLLIAPSY